ncbi:MAG: hypothetical protein FWH41_10790, partial [Treponema sp.]|nr:hypothetical protein [Treponema sp.]
MTQKTKRMFSGAAALAGIILLLFATACGKEDNSKPGTFSLSRGNITGDGTIGISPEGQVKAGAKITLTASPGTHYEFGGWNISPEVKLETGSSGTWTFKMPSKDVSIGASFTLANGFYIIQQGNITGEGTYEINPEGPFEEGDEITITALPGEHYAFVSWDISPEVNPVELYGGEWTFQMPDENVTVNAEFARTYSIISKEIIFGKKGDDEILGSEGDFMPGEQVSLSISISGRRAIIRWSFTPDSVVKSLRTGTAPRS